MGVTARMASSNEIRVNVNVTGEDQAARDLKKVEKAAEGAGEAIDDLGTTATDAGKKTEDAGESFDKTGDKAGFLKKRVAELEGELKNLIERLNSTGDTSLEKDIRKTEREARKYGRLLKQLGAEIVDDAQKVGKAAGGTLIEGLADGFKTGSAALKGAGIPILIGIAVAAAPAVGATIGAAVLGGVGAGGILGGVAAAVNDPFIGEAAEKLGGQLGAAFTELGRSTFGGPLLESFQILETAGKNFASGIKPGLQGVAPLLVPLANGLEGLATHAVPGLNKALTAAKPVLRILADELPQIGDAIADFFGSVADGQGGATMAMKGLLDTIEATTVAAGNVIEVLSNIFEWSVNATAGINSFLGDAFSWVPFIGDNLQNLGHRTEEMAAAAQKGKSDANDFSGSLDVVGTSAADAAAQIEGMKNAIDDLFGIEMGLERAQVAAAQGMKDLVKELRDGPKVIDLVSEAGIRNRQALDSQITALNDVRKAQIESGMPIEEANKRFRNQIDTITNLAHGLGFAGKEFDTFMAKWRSAPDEAEKIYRFKIEATAGSATAWSMVRAAERQLEGRATGGPVKAGRTYRVGENGPEIVTFGEDGYVHNAADTRAMMSGASGGAASAWGGSGMQEIRVVIDIQGDDEEQVRRIRKQVDVLGGGNVQVAFGKNY